MTVYSGTCPFSLGWSLCKNVSISTSFCRSIWFFLVSDCAAWLGAFHLLKQMFWEIIYKVTAVIVNNIAMSVWYISLVSGSNCDADHYQRCNTNNKSKDDDPTCRNLKVWVNMIAYLTFIGPERGSFPHSLGVLCPALGDGAGPFSGSLTKMKNITLIKTI